MTIDLSTVKSAIDAINADPRGDRAKLRASFDTVQKFWQGLMRTNPKEASVVHRTMLKPLREQMRADIAARKELQRAASVEVEKVVTQAIADDKSGAPDPEKRARESIEVSLKEGLVALDPDAHQRKQPPTEREALEGPQ